MKRVFAMVLVLCMAPFMTSCAYAVSAPQGTDTAAGALLLSEPLEGEGRLVAADTSSPIAFTYSLPQFEAQLPTDEEINDFYRSYAQDLLADAEGGGESENIDPSFDEADSLSLTYAVMHNSERYVSVVISGAYFYSESGAEHTFIEAATFARDGVYAGQPLTLSQILGLEQEDGELGEETSVAEKLAYELVWQIVERESQNADAGYLDGLTAERVSEAFYPESDFYLDAEGNIVLFIQAGEIAGDMAGILTFPFAPAELLSAAKK